MVNKIHISNEINTWSWSYRHQMVKFSPLLVSDSEIFRGLFSYLTHFLILIHSAQSQINTTQRLISRVFSDLESFITFETQTRAPPATKPTKIFQRKQKMTSFDFRSEHSHTISRNLSRQHYVLNLLKPPGWFLQRSVEASQPQEGPGSSLI